MRQFRPPGSPVPKEPLIWVRLPSKTVAGALKEQGEGRAH